MKRYYIAYAYSFLIFQVSIGFAGPSLSKELGDVEVSRFENNGLRVYRSLAESYDARFEILLNYVVDKDGVLILKKSSLGLMPKTHASTSSFLSLVSASIFGRPDKAPIAAGVDVHVNAKKINDTKCSVAFPEVESIRKKNYAETIGEFNARQREKAGASASRCEIRVGSLSESGAAEREALILRLVALEN